MQDQAMQSEAVFNNVTTGKGSLTVGRRCSRNGFFLPQCGFVQVGGRQIDRGIGPLVDVNAIFQGGVLDQHSIACRQCNRVIAITFCLREMINRQLLPLCGVGEIQIFQIGCGQVLGTDKDVSVE